MASGDPVVQIINASAPGTLAASADIVEGGSTVKEEIPVWDFNDSAASYIDYTCRLHGYNSSGLTFRIFWSASTAASGTVQWEIGVRRLDDNGEDMDSSHTYDYNTTSVTTADAIGEVDYATITFTNGSDMDSWADGEMAIVRVRRNPAGTDTMSGDAELWGIFGEET